nr:MAG TPA: hypothetical protein [Bacteriophage sp.]
MMVIILSLIIIGIGTILKKKIFFCPYSYI